MAPRRKFAELSAEARKAPARRARIDAARKGVLEDIKSYRLSELRRALGITQAELAQHIGKSQSAVSQIESGDIGISLDVLRSIVRELGGTLEVSAVFDDGRVELDT